MLTLLRTGRPDVTVSRTANYKTARQLTKEDLDIVLNHIEFASTDVQVSINNKKYIVEIMTCDNEIDFDVLEKQVYISRYGIFEEDYDEKFNNK